MNRAVASDILIGLCFDFWNWLSSEDMTAMNLKLDYLIKYGRLVGEGYEVSLP